MHVRLSMLLDEYCVCWNSNPMLHSTNLVRTVRRQALSGTTISRLAIPREELRENAALQRHCSKSTILSRSFNGRFTAQKVRAL